MILLYAIHLYYQIFFYVYVLNYPLVTWWQPTMKLKCSICVENGVDWEYISVKSTHRKWRHQWCARYCNSINATDIPCSVSCLCMHLKQILIPSCMHHSLRAGYLLKVEYGNFIKCIYRTEPSLIYINLINPLPRCNLIDISPVFSVY